MNLHLKYWSESHKTKSLHSFYTPESTGENFIGLFEILFEILGFLVVRNLENEKRRKWSEKYGSLRHFLSSKTVKRRQLHR